MWSYQPLEYVFARLMIGAEEVVVKVDGASMPATTSRAAILRVSRSSDWDKWASRRKSQNMEANSTTQAWRLARGRMLWGHG